MPAGFFIKAKDRLPVLYAALQQPSGVAVNLAASGVGSVAFHMQHVGGLASLSALATVASAAGGYVGYVWASANTDIAGNYEAEFEVTYSDGTKQSFPNDSNFSVVILPELG